jgi:hypothetical protein
MDKRVFYLHEDEWGMVQILPSENFTRTVEIAQEANNFGQEHFDGFGWTDMYVIPEEKHPISIRKIPFVELSNLVGNVLSPADIVQSGYSSYRETLKNCFAFGESNSEAGLFYGSQKDGIVVALNFFPCEPGNSGMVAVLTDILVTLGEKYDLILADWWIDAVVRLQSREAVSSYFTFRA